MAPVGLRFPRHTRLGRYGCTHGQTQPPNQRFLQPRRPSRLEAIHRPLVVGAPAGQAGHAIHARSVGEDRRRYRNGLRPSRLARSVQVAKRRHDRTRYGHGRLAEADRVGRCARQGGQPGHHVRPVAEQGDRLVRRCEGHRHQRAVSRSDLRLQRHRRLVPLCLSQERYESRRHRPDRFSPYAGRQARFRHGRQRRALLLRGRQAGEVLRHERRRPGLRPGKRPMRAPLPPGLPSTV